MSEIHSLESLSYDSIYLKYGLSSQPIKTSDLLQALNELVGSDLTPFFDDYIYGTTPLPALWE